MNKLNGKHKMSKAEWIQHQRDVEQQKRFILEKGKREVVQQRIDRKTEEIKDSLRMRMELEARLKDEEAKTAGLKEEREALRNEFHILNVGSLWWPDIQNAIAEMQDRRD